MKKSKIKTLCLALLILAAVIAVIALTGLMSRGTGKTGQASGEAVTEAEESTNAPEKTGTAVEENDTAPEETRAVILATSDIHANIWGYSYEDNKETDNNGMARLYTYIKKVREEEPVVFLVDAGDEIQGTIMTDDIANKTPDSEHPVMTAMNFMDYDCMTLGNHEFDWGVAVMKKILGQAGFPILGANILDENGDYIAGDGWIILERGGIRLAVIGVCTPDVTILEKDKEGVADTTFEAANTAVKKAMEEIGDKADIILVSAHMGQYPEYDEENESDAGEMIIEDNPDIDILQVAHMHITVNDKVNDIPIAGVRNAGREIARFDVTLDRDRKIKDISTSIVDMADYEPSEEIREIPVVKALHEQTIQYIQGNPDDENDKGEVIGTTTSRFQPDDEIKGLPEGRLKDTAVIDLIHKVQLLNSGADVSACSLFKSDSDLPEGTIYYRNIFDIYKYDNTLYRINVTGKELKDYMEWTAGFYNQWEPGDINISFDPEFPDYLYDMFAGVDYEIDISRPKGERIQNVMFRGEPLKDDQVLKLCVSNYRYSAALRPNKLVSGRPDWESSCSVRDMIVDYFKQNSPVEPEIYNNWRITGADLSVNDPRRKEIIDYINDGSLPAPVNKSYNLKDYDALEAEAKGGSTSE